MKKTYRAYALLLVLACFAGNVAAQNTLTAQEKKDGWKLLFDGKTTKGWHNYNKKTIGQGWKVADGELYLDNSTKEGRGDIVTDGEYQNYEFSYQWKIDSCGNSGVMFNVVEDPAQNAPYHSGPEMQVLDNDCHKDGKIVKHRTGDLYDLISSSKETVRPVGEWNEARIVSKNAKMEFWLNGTKVVEFTMHTPEWDQLVANSKFKTWPVFGKSLKGHLALQDHGDKVWFRNLKIKELK
ncbi:3-keto-disaccharide hydrolase [Chryseolinea lacunae]|uniref:DUF1080 domain-containing protein n=1 Tax=Chryseolinea lacunae TaxID=2801331 RepID=A0ABS1KW61_9BACT|nr:DUF1080 domain-containing protein [Chryseolinea lacunae]MBL0743649.1 DUF1080 domain-containing protein [Chryseolinea lacunae]